MATVGHIAVGMAAGRLSHDKQSRLWSSLLPWAGLSLLPDVDVIGLWLGVDYADPWGHRGATHSLLFSVAVALVIGLGARRFGRRFGRTAAFAALVLSSHALLDTMTNGGLGCALLWPFDSTRYFAPWRPIPVAPIGLGFFSPSGAPIILTELVLFAPALLFGLRFPGIQRRFLTSTILGLWLISAWLLASGDRVRDAVVGFLLREDTAYAAGFSEKAFRTITTGQSDKEVQSLLGAPIGENWLYPSGEHPAQAASERSAEAISGECLAIRFENDVVTSAHSPTACNKLGVRNGLSTTAVGRVLGSPPERCWQYSWSRSGGRYRIRLVCFTKATVTTVVRQWE